MARPPESLERLMPTFPRQGVSSTQWQLSSSEDDTLVRLSFSARPVIPVVFLPGVMATNLRKRSKSATVIWQPPNIDWHGMGHLVKTLLKYLFKGSAKRQEELNPDDSEVFYQGEIYPTKGPLEPVEILRARGWGSIMRSAYHPMMHDLQKKLNNVVSLHGVFPWWQKDGPGRFPHPQTGVSVSENDVRALANYRFDVWGGGYNWLQSNVDSAIDIIHWLEAELPQYYNRDGRQLLAKTKDNKIPVILVTHSMGGFVARSISDLLKPDSALKALAQKELSGSERTIDVLGVNHIAMPAEGAPKLYMHMRSGYPGAAGVILSRNSADFLAIAYRIKSTFELMPFRSYNGGKPWLFISEKCKKCQFIACGHNQLHGGTPSESLTLPRNGDPFADIYTATHAFGLVPDHNLHLVYPGKRKDRVRAEELQMARDKLNRNIDDADKFQNCIMSSYHQPTYAYWKDEGESKKTAHTDEAKKDYFVSGPVVWKGPAVHLDVPRTVPTSTRRNPIRDYGTGLMIYGWEPNVTGGRDYRPRWRICDGFLPGDGTVDEISGSAPSKIASTAMITASHTGLETVRKRIAQEKRKKTSSFDHQDICNDESVQWFSCHAVAKIVAKSAGNTLVIPKHWWSS